MTVFALSHCRDFTPSFSLDSQVLTNIYINFNQIMQICGGEAGRALLELLYDPSTAENYLLVKEHVFIYYKYNK